MFDFLTLSPGFASMLVRLFIDVIVTWLIIDRLYYRKSKRRDFYFTFMLISIAIFFIVFFMIFVLEDMKGKTSMGIGIGLTELFKRKEGADSFAKIRERAMSQDFSWSSSADEYIALYKKLIEK